MKPPQRFPRHVPPASFGDILYQQHQQERDDESRRKLLMRMGPERRRRLGLDDAREIDKFLHPRKTMTTCPVCHSRDVDSTTIGGIGEQDAFADRNRAKCCSCGARGSVGDWNLVEAMEQPHTVLRDLMDAVGSSRGPTTIIAMGPNHPMRPAWDSLVLELNRCPTFDELVRRHYAPKQ